MNANLKTMKWLIKREFWENKGMFFWTPIAMGVFCCIVFPLIMLKYMPWEAYTKQASAMAQGLYPNMYDGDRSIAAMNIVDIYMGFAVLIFFIVSLLSTYYLIGSLFNDRQDKSILFWKSMPISETQTVFSKIIFSMVFVPLISFLIGFVFYILFCILGSLIFWYHGYNVFLSVFTNINILIKPLKVLSLYPIYVLWALPSIGWYLMVSAWAKSRVFPWAIGVPFFLMLMIFIGMKFSSEEKEIVVFFLDGLDRLAMGLIPGSWVIGLEIPPDVTPSSLYLRFSYYQTQGYLALTSIKLWAGALLSIILIAASIYLRKHQKDI